MGWFARPAKANGDAVRLLHGVGDNRKAMMGFAELFLSNGFGALVPDSRAQAKVNSAIQNSRPAFYFFPVTR
jgi:hypothetical protein